MDGRVACPVCRTEVTSLRELAVHLVEQADASEGGHVMWLNRHVTKHRTTVSDLEPLLAEALAGGSSSDRVAR